jgi:hypothetical protein
MFEPLGFRAKVAGNPGHCLDGIFVRRIMFDGDCHANRSPQRCSLLASATVSGISRTSAIICGQCGLREPLPDMTALLTDSPAFSSTYIYRLREPQFSPDQKSPPLTPVNPSTDAVYPPGKVVWMIGIIHGNVSAPIMNQIATEKMARTLQRNTA